MSNQSNDIAFTHTHELLSDGTVAFLCDRDETAWPWLTLPSVHPLVLQSINYWASVETGKTRGTLDPDKWSALTYSRWECGTRPTGPITHGLADHPGDGFKPDEPAFRLTFFDSAGALVGRMIGTGVVFRTRDFEGWRQKSRTSVHAAEEGPRLVYAAPRALGVATPVECFLTPLSPTDGRSAQGLITRANGLMPHHPYHGGSGDHVNANHLADAAFQFAHLLHPGQRLRCRAGEMRFRHYVELGKPFTVQEIKAEVAAGESGAVVLEVSQGGRLCTEVTLWVEACAVG